MKLIFEDRASFNQALSTLNDKENFDENFDVGYSDMIISFFSIWAMIDGVRILERDSIPGWKI